MAEKVKVHFLAVGSAPIMKKSKFLVDGAGQFMTVSAFLRKQLKLKPGDPLVRISHSAVCIVSPHLPPFLPTSFCIVIMHLHQAQISSSAI
jgi:hypothetical protein